MRGLFAPIGPIAGTQRHGRLANGRPFRVGNPGNHQNHPALSPLTEGMSEWARHSTPATADLGLRTNGLAEDTGAGATATEGL